MTRTRPPVRDEPPPPRRRRALSDEERALWDSVAKQTRPLRNTTLQTKAHAAKAALAAAIETSPTAPAAAPAIAKPGQPKPLRLKPDAPKPVPPLTPLGRRERSQLARGKKEIAARIDLHGMTQSRAHHALLGFLQRASGDGLAFVLVITGKGRTAGPDSERGILRRQVPLWLALPEFRALVVGYEEAGIGHGGEGALYVRLRRMR